MPPKRFRPSEVKPIDSAYFFVTDFKASEAYTKLRAEVVQQLLKEYHQSDNNINSEADLPFDCVRRNVDVRISIMWNELPEHEKQPHHDAAEALRQQSISELRAAGRIMGEDDPDDEERPPTPTKPETRQHPDDIDYGNLSAYECYVWDENDAIDYQDMICEENPNAGFDKLFSGENEDDPVVVELQEKMGAMIAEKLEKKWKEKSSAEKESYYELELAYKIGKWRELRRLGGLIETEFTLAQKKLDEEKPNDAPLYVAQKLLKEGNLHYERVDPHADGNSNEKGKNKDCPADVDDDVDENDS